VATSAIRQPTLSDTYLPAANALQQLALIVAGSLLLAAASQLTLPLPFTPVPLTGQSFAVLLIGASLGSKRGPAAVLLYVLEGWSGLPFFAAGATVASAGYLFGFVLAAAVVGFLAERGFDRHFGRAVVAMLAGQAAIFLVGVPWLGTFVGMSHAIPMGLVPFIPGDLLKLLLAAATLPLVWKVLPEKRQR
jgi:biotin transporter BioY